MWQKELNFDIDLLRDCQKEFVSVDKQQFLQSRIMDRLEQCNAEQLEDFDQWLKEVNDFVDSEDCNILDLARVVNRLSRYSKQLCSVELTLFDLLEEYI